MPALPVVTGTELDNVIDFITFILAISFSASVMVSLSFVLVPIELFAQETSREDSNNKTKNFFILSYLLLSIN